MRKEKKKRKFNFKIKFLNFKYLSHKNEKSGNRRNNQWDISKDFLNSSSNSISWFIENISLVNIVQCICWWFNTFSITVEVINVTNQTFILFIKKETICLISLFSDTRYNTRFVLENIIICTKITLFYSIVIKTAVITVFNVASVRSFTFSIL